MREIEEVLEDICKKRAEISQMEDERVSKLNTTQNPALRDEVAQLYQKYIARKKEEVGATLSELIRWPPHKVEHFAKLKEFFAEYDYDKSVFIMTKYPAKPPTPLDVQLKKVIDIVHDAIADCGYIPHLATDRKYQPEIFRNIEVYMLGCSKAIAIVESQHTKELNPNVTMEWGWFRCTGREVLFLVEKNFDRKRADIEGLINDEFDWDDPEPGIKPAVKGFLKP
jgi:hypothetical protein